MMHRFPFALSLLALATTALPARAQDPAREIQEIARAIEEQLQEIDRLLLESGKAGQARTEPKQMLQQANERSATVRDGIDKLIEKLNEMKNQSGSGQGEGEGQGQGQGREQGGQQNQGQPQSPQNRRENQTPDFVQQPKPDGQDQQQQQQQQQPGGQTPQGQNQPQGGEQAHDQPENRTGKQPPEGELGPGQPGQGEAGWGELQPYVNFLKNRGSAPKVPEKYRKYWEAYLKNKQGAGGR